MNSTGLHFFNLKLLWYVPLESSVWHLDTCMLAGLCSQERNWAKLFIGKY